MTFWADLKAQLTGQPATSTATRVELRSWAKGSARNVGSPRPKGTVTVQASPLVRCDECGSHWHGSPGVPHGVHSLPAPCNGRPTFVDCVGNEVERDHAAANGWRWVGRAS